MQIRLLCQDPKTDLQRHHSRWWCRNGTEKRNLQEKETHILPCIMAEAYHNIPIGFKCQFLSRSFPVPCLLNSNPRCESICSSQQPLLHLRMQFHHQPNPICATNLPLSMSLDMEASFPLASAIMKTCSELGNPKLTLSFHPKVTFSQSWIAACLQGCKAWSNRVNMHVGTTPFLQESNN